MNAPRKFDDEVSVEALATELGIIDPGVLVGRAEAIIARTFKAGGINAITGMSTTSHLQGQTTRIYVTNKLADAIRAEHKQS